LVNNNMNGPTPFSERIDAIRKDKQSNLVLAIDPAYRTGELLEYILDLIASLGKHACAIKLNFHVILPLSAAELKKVNSVAHEEKLQVVADIKLNDIPSTNEVAIQHLHSMGFDAIIVNPFVGKGGLKSAVDFAHSLNCGVISLVYMSHSGATESFGAPVVADSLNSSPSKPASLYRIFYENSKDCGVDGVVVGGNRLDILRELSQKSSKKRVPIYSPGLITQGGDVKSALDCGSDYLIIGRAITTSANPAVEMQNAHNLVKEYVGG